MKSNRTLFNGEQNSRNLFILLWCFLCCALWVMSLETWTINGTVKCHANRFAVFSLSLSVLLIWPLFCSCKTHQRNCTFQTKTSSYTAKGKGKSEIRKNETRPNTHFQWYLSIGDTKQMTDLDHFVPYYLTWRWIEKKWLHDFRANAVQMAVIATLLVHFGILQRVVPSDSFPLFLVHRSDFFIFSSV